jgi:phosphohistidine phosphatase
MACDRQRRLVVVRHAKAEPHGTRPDHERALTPRGRRDAAAVGAWLVGQRLRPDLALCSDAVRAQQTWEAARAALGEVPTRLEPRLYDVSAASVVQLIAETDAGVGTLVVVGHEPTMSAVGAALAGPESDGAAVASLRAHFPTAGVAVLTLDGEWSALQADACTLVAVAAPRG